MNIPAIQIPADSAAPDLIGGLADTLHAAGHGAAHGGGENGPVDFTELLHHVQDARELDTPFGILHLPQFPPIHAAGLTID